MSEKKTLLLYLLIFDGFGIRLHSVFILLSLKVLISFLFHFFTFLDEEQDKNLGIVEVMAGSWYLKSDPSPEHGNM